MSNGLSTLNSLNRSISYIRGVWCQFACSVKGIFYRKKQKEKYFKMLSAEISTQGLLPIFHRGM